MTAIKAERAPRLSDRRYTVTREWCGCAEPKWIARFCGDWIGKGDHKSDALMLCVAHDDNRGV